jgi:glutaredoxin
LSEVILYSRPGCHLCDEARSVLQAELVPFAELDIESDDALFKRYLERIPVISIDGEDVFEFFVDVDELRERIGSPNAGPKANQR